MPSEWILSLSYAFIIGTLGEVAKGLARAKAGDTGWRGVFYVTYKAHGLFAGAFGAIPLHEAGVQIPELFGGTSLVSYMIWGATFGALAMVGYTMSVGLLKSWFKHKQAQILGRAREEGDSEDSR